MYSNFLYAFLIPFVGGYDSHFILQSYASEDFQIIDDADGHELVDADTHQFTAQSKGRNLQVLAKSFEKFISLQVDKHVVFKVNIL